MILISQITISYLHFDENYLIFILLLLLFLYLIPSFVICILLEGYLCGDEEGNEHHEGEHVEADVVVPLPLVHLAPKGSRK